jgi:hypothetical protein
MKENYADFAIIFFLMVHAILTLFVGVLHFVSSTTRRFLKSILLAGSIGLYLSLVLPIVLSMQDKPQQRCEWVSHVFGAMVLSLCIVTKLEISQKIVPFFPICNQKCIRMMQYLQIAVQLVLHWPGWIPTFLFPLELSSFFIQWYHAGIILHLLLSLVHSHALVGALTLLVRQRLQNHFKTSFLIYIGFMAILDWVAILLYVSTWSFPYTFTAVNYQILFLLAILHDLKSLELKKGIARRNSAGSTKNNSAKSTAQPLNSPNEPPPPPLERFHSFRSKTSMTSL